MTTMPPIAIEGLRAQTDLSDRRREEMFRLLSRHFSGVTREQFDHDLAGKNWVIELVVEGELVGFSTMLVTGTDWAGEMLTIIYSGDTIVNPTAWGSPLLARTWIRAVNALRAAHPQRRCYWLLLTSGFRTYRFLPVFWREFYPRFAAPTPAATQRLLDHLANGAYSSLYESTTGLVRFPYPQRLRGPLQALPTGRLADPHIAHFLALNPNHAEGDELVCLTEISTANFTRAGQRMVAAHPR